MKHEKTLKSQALRMEKEEKGHEKDKSPKHMSPKHKEECCGNHMKKHEGHPHGCCHEKQG